MVPRGAPARYEKILPLPFVHVIVDLSDPCRIFDRSGIPATVPEAFVSGIQPEYLVIEAPEVIRHVGVALRPEGLAALTDAPGTEVAGRVQDARGIVSGIDAITDRLRRAACDPDAALDVLGAFVAERGAGRSPDGAVQHVVLSLASDPDRRIGDLAAETGLSHRTLIARFRRATGLTPKAFAQVDRFHRFLMAATGQEPPDWAALAGASAYYDQPHVIRGFRRFCGWTPTEYRRRIAEFGPEAASFVPLDEVPADGMPVGGTPTGDAPVGVDVQARS